MAFASERELFEAIEAREKDADDYRSTLAQRFGIDGSYYESVQWISQSGFSRDRSNTYARLRPNYNPDSTHLRVTHNETSRLTQKSAASTHPDEIYMDVRPGERNFSQDGDFRARVHESVVNAMIDHTAYLKAAQLANHRRSVFGVWGMGLAHTVGPVRINGEMAQSAFLRAFEFDPLNLILDPSCQCLDLHDHPFVIFTDVWPLAKIKATFGIEIDPETARTVEQLEPQKIDLNRLSNNRLFSRYARQARTKAARIYQVHERDAFSRFPQWHIVIEDGERNKRLVNEDSTDSPFAGTGLPFILLHGYLRADTMWSWGEPAQIKEMQDKMNLLETQKFRIVQEMSSPKYAVDRRAFGANVTDDDIQRKFDNRVGGVVAYTLSDRVRNVQPPTVLAPPPPPSFLFSELDRYREIARESTHKAPGNFGLEKSHVPFQTTSRVLDDADQVASVRVAKDALSHTYLIGVLHATTLRMVQGREVAVLASLRRAGLDAGDFAVLADTDPDHPGVELSVKQSSIRHRSHASRKADLDNAAAMQMVDPETYRRTMADTLQTPLSEEDRQMSAKANRAVLAVLYGQEWRPHPLGRWAGMFIDVFIRATTDPRAEDPATLNRLTSAVQSMYEMQRQEMLLSNPELALKLAQSGGGTPGGSEAQPAPEAAQSVSVADVLDALSQSGPAGVGGQPAPAA